MSNDDATNERQQRRVREAAARERVVRALEHPDVLAVLLLHEVAKAEHLRSRRPRRRRRSKHTIGKKPVRLACK